MEGASCLRSGTAIDTDTWFPVPTTTSTPNLRFSAAAAAAPVIPEPATTLLGSAAVMLALVHRPKRLDAGR